MNGAQLFLAGIAALAVTSVAVKARAGVRRARAAADIARAGMSPVSLVGWVLVTVVVIVGVQWLVLTHTDTVTLRWVVLGFPALVTACTVTKALTVVEINPARKAGGRR
jgi:hypothetical protein